jgi:hypothetical protein
MLCAEVRCGAFLIPHAAYPGVSLAALEEVHAWSGSAPPIGNNACMACAALAGEFVAIGARSMRRAAARG